MSNYRENQKDIDLYFICAKARLFGTGLEVIVYYLELMGPFVAPSDPSDYYRVLQASLAQIREWP